MLFLFSKKLIDRTIKCFKEEDGLDISEETANEYLNGLSGLFLAFADSESGPAPLGADGLASRSKSGNSDQGVSNTLGTL
ncbi:MAG: hypothetical protein JWP09_881 [Candidatus Taylorbacteria bacterium]|nr:hypothetical protein [Candidatus Taylorbacteria bacterium]